MKDIELVISVEREKKEIDKKRLALLEKECNCYFCGIDITNDRNIHYRDKDQEHYASCSLCYYTEHIDKVIAINKGNMILMPEITQIELNNIIRMIWYLESITEDKYLDKIDSAINLYEQIKERANFVDNYYSEGANDVNIIINFLHNVKIEKYKKRNIGLYGLLWLPEKEIFSNQLEEWNRIFSEYQPDNFIKIINQVKELVEKENV